MYNYRMDFLVVFEMEVERLFILVIRIVEV